MKDNYCEPTAIQKIKDESIICQIWCDKKWPTESKNRNECEKKMKLNFSEQVPPYFQKKLLGFVQS